MRTLVTGAAGFVGRNAVAELARRGHEVVALVRPGTSAERRAFPDGVRTVEADLRRDSLDAALEGVHTVVHLAAKVLGSDEERFAAAVVGSERLLAAGAAAGIRRFVLVSSYAVYDWSQASGTLDESTPLVERPYGRDGYTVAKVWQERVARRAAERDGFELVVLRPGFVWGPRSMEVAGAGVPAGPLLVVVGPLARLPLTYVENCAACIGAAVEEPAAAGATLNVVDGDGVRAWRYAREQERRGGTGRLRVPVPYVVALALVNAVAAVSRRAFRHGGRLPSVLTPIRFEARFKPLRHSGARAERVLGWAPGLDFEEAVGRCR
jgi:UDP-glucose 4-epimerase